MSSGKDERLSLQGAIGVFQKDKEGKKSHYKPEKERNKDPEERKLP